MDHELSGNNLYIRNGEVFRVEEKRPDNLPAYERVYCVAITPTPTVPDVVVKHNNLRHQAVICCEMFPTIESNYVSGIGWVHLGPDEKRIIGLELEAIGAKFDQWYYFIIDTRKYRY